MRFEIDHLESYDDEALLYEVRRVAAIVGSRKLTIGQFSAIAKVHGSTLQKRFGGWVKALKAAGLADLADTSNLPRSREDVLTTIASLKAKLGKGSLTLTEFTAHTGITGAPIRRLFGNWKSALDILGIEQSALAKRYTDESCFENLLSLWTHYGRPPQHDEMNIPPSVVGSKAYIRRWGTWRKALSAFVTRVNLPVGLEAEPESTAVVVDCTTVPASNENRGPRDIPLALRYYVLRRDSFRCITCGASPAISVGVILHIDHVIPWAKGGKTIAENLRTLCESCNLGKGASPA
ncbi:MAG: HNH endonuclease [Candidatus Desulfobacillus denitrificans]